MSFVNQSSFILRKSDKSLVNIYFNNQLQLDFYNCDNELTFSTYLKNINSSFSTTINFCIDKYDTIYGIYKNNGLKLITISNSTTKITQRDILSYNHKKFDIIFPYLKVIDNSYHILYYLYSNSSRNTCALFHHYYKNGVWTENKIDFIDHIIMDNFNVLWVNDSPIVFYLNVVDGFEEVFFSRFNLSTLTWSKPCQITNSKKNKLYLSVIKDSMNFYHITFCENINSGYLIRYMNGFLQDNGFEFEISKYITGPSTCMYPTLIKESGDLYLMWVNFNKLYVCLSNDLGTTWSEADIDEYSIEDDFIRSSFLSNYKGDMSFNLSHAYNTYKNIDILGF